jgi:protein-tyrosine phosphatase
MDITWITDRIAVGGGIWTDEKMGEVARAGITHVIDMQIEFDDTPLAEPYGIAVLWNPVDDDFQHKSPSVFHRGVEFAFRALDDPGAKLYIHCAAGVHRAPMMTLAVMGTLGWSVDDGMQLIQMRRPVVDFADVYVESVERFLEGFQREGRENEVARR